MRELARRKLGRVDLLNRDLPRIDVLLQADAEALREIREPGGYNLVRLKGSKESAPARAFREWLTVEMAESHRRFASLKA